MFIIQLTVLIIKAPQTAGQKPWTSKPLRMEATILSIRPFMIKVRSPKVRTFRGRVKINTTGRIKVFSIPRIKAPARAGRNPVISIPSTTWAARKRAPAFMIQRMRMPFILLPGVHPEAPGISLLMGRSIQTGRFSPPFHLVLVGIFFSFLPAILADYPGIVSSSLDSGFSTAENTSQFFHLRCLLFFHSRDHVSNSHFNTFAKADLPA